MMTGKQITAMLLACLLAGPGVNPVFAADFTLEASAEPAAPAASDKTENPAAQTPSDDKENDADQSTGDTQTGDKLEEAEKKIEAVKAKIAKGSLGFFEYVRDLNDRHSADAVKALGVFENEKLSSYTKFGSVSDAISLKQMEKTLEMLAKCNELRMDNDLPALNVSLYLTAVAQKQLNYSATSMTHALAFNPSGENLAWGVKDPFDGWYDQEKAIFDKYVDAGLDMDAIYSDHKGEVSHYLNLIDARFHTTGFAHSATSQFGKTPDAWNQVFGMSEGGYSVNEYTTIFKKYCRSLEKELLEAALPMHRLYNYDSGEHFYTGDENEYRELVKDGWKDEGIGWYAPKSSDTPVFRLCNPSNGDHHYTTSENERDTLVKTFGWKDEGIGWFSDSQKGMPLYRQYNPNAEAGAHNYTVSLEENEQLVKLGWLPEDIGWYGLKLID